ncbi:hypothetical protein D1007_04665 [Hordeum vulgare]|nr:hypothetical protein D1007_04665 [Hordeum vulgare]
MGAANPADSPAGEKPRRGMAVIEGPMSAHEWDQVKARARRILRRSRDWKIIREWTRKCNTDLLGVISERREIFSSPGGLPRSLKRSTATYLRECDMVSLVPATPLGEKISTLIGDPDGLFCGVEEGSSMGMSLRRFLREKTEWSAASPASATALMGEEPSVGASIGGGLFTAQEWEFFRAQSRRFLRRAQRREDCLLQSRIRAQQMIFGTDTREFPIDPNYAVISGNSACVVPVISADSGKEGCRDLVQAVKEDFSIILNPSNVSCGKFPINLKDLERNHRGEELIVGIPYIVYDPVSIEGNFLNNGRYVRKLNFLGHLFCNQCFTSFGEDALLWEYGGYFWPFGKSCRSSCNPCQHPFISASSFPNCVVVLRDMDIRGEVEVRSMKMLQETVESGGGVSVPALQMDALVVDWKSQGAITAQEVASEDGRFVLNFVAEGDRRFVLKAQPWHYRRDGVIFAEFNGKGDPAEVDLGVMAIWAQVRDLPFELKTESMGRMLGDQLGEVLEVSHRNHIIVEKFLRVRIEILLHEPLKTFVGFTPLGSSKQLKFDVCYEKLPVYCECCGLVGHTSERFCNIPSEKIVPSYPKNLRVEAYWKSQGTSTRALKFGSFPRGDMIPKEGTEGSISDGIVVKVTTAVRGLKVADKAPAPPTKMDASTEAMVAAPNKASTASVGAKFSAQADAKLGQEGRVGGSRR